ncbi:MAG: zinc ribbon domain-containing protein [Gammaproteobacteria bacterium]|nr:zinc ribbon domain-containing protein [Gammaproteobacteria bacterium]MDH3415524.1 zinc ribbon domain-containing protein [Gammaproteobacteria bacterium]
MPIYAYACKKCEHTLDALQKIADEPLVDCPECGEAALKRLITAPRFRLKGQGWYETDFKKDNQRNLAGDKEPAVAKEKKSEDKTSVKTSVKKTSEAS